MKLISLCRMALKHTRSSVAEELYLKAGYDRTRPTTIYGVTNLRCNYRCRYCGYWRRPNEHEAEMSIDEWKSSLLSLKKFIGPFHIEFSGGEPFLKKGFIDLLKFCHEIGLHWGVTTNGSSFSDRVVREVVAARPFNMNISIDSHIPDIHDYARGIPGSLERVTRGLKRLIREREMQHIDFPVIIKPTVHANNFHTLPDMVEWVKNIGATAINFQPMDRWTDETHEEMWINEEKIPDLEETINRLDILKHKGAPILNSHQLMKLWPSHFREEKAPPEALPCRVGLRNYFIRTNGDVEVCWHFPPIGNVMEQSAKEIWRSEKANIRRKETVECSRLCLYTCLSQKTIFDKIKMGITLITGLRDT